MATLKHLRKTLDLKLSEILKLDLAIGVAGAAGAGVMSVLATRKVIAAAPWVIAVVIAIVGAVLAGIAVQVAFFDQSFLRKLRAINTDPVRYLAPFLFTATMGIFALLPLTVLAFLGPATPVVITCVVSIIAGLSSVWSVASLLPDLDTLIQFVHLKMDALDVPDDVGKDAPRFGNGREPKAG